MDLQVKTTATTDAISLYMAEIAQYPILSAEEEKELAVKIANGDKAAKEKFIKSNLRLVVSVANRYKDKKFDMLDLIQEGNMGLLKAVELFDHTKGWRFSTYATWWIKQSILRGIATKSDPIRIPDKVKQELYQVQIAKQHIYLKKGRTATDNEIVKETKISLRELKRIKEFTYSVSSLNVRNVDDDTEWEDNLPDGKLTPEEFVLLKSKRESLENLISESNLSEQELLVINRRYDLKGNEFRTLEEISKEMHRSKERIRMIETKALRKMRYYAKYSDEYSDFK